jgi:hypothetical protein
MEVTAQPTLTAVNLFEGSYRWDMWQKRDRDQIEFSRLRRENRLDSVCEFIRLSFQLV